ncbi:MAG: TetR/AcrR family transcriptional regulator [Clostridia bacterium]|nr:TetR/AcrR family transcriptional regulator [Clostridia bacterium]
MDDIINNVDQGVKERLLVAGIREVELHGFNDFSLRRVASLCNLSCAAPYRHFKGKEELLVEIFKYINSRWQMLAGEIEKAFDNDAGRRLRELCTAYLRFLIVTPSYLSMIFQKNQLTEEIAKLPQPDAFLGEQVELYGAEKGWDGAKCDETQYRLRAMIYGTALIIRNCEKGEENSLVDKFRQDLEFIK